jgi:hypothetical protein
MEQKDFGGIFAKERSEWSKKIQSLSVRMRNIREVAEVQIELLSDRQKVLEYKHSLAQALSKLNSEFRKRKKDQLVHHSEKSTANYKYGANEKTTLIDGDLTELKARIDLVDDQISYMNETMKTIDHGLFGIKTRIELENHLLGLSK